MPQSFLDTDHFCSLCLRVEQGNTRFNPFGLSLFPRVFTKVVGGALAPLWDVGIRILNYLDHWLIMAHMALIMSREELCEHRDLVLRHLSQLGLQVNRENCKLSPMQRISFSPHGLPI